MPKLSLKTNLHLHTNDDPKDGINYSFEEMIDYASDKKFDVISVTCHGKVVKGEKYSDYAKSKGILFIPGVEMRLKEGDVLILNATKDAEELKSLGDLRVYKKEHPETLIVAPHPYYIFSSLGREFEENLELFDAVEFSWFYSKAINPNLLAEKLAKKNNLPIVATSDTHELDKLNKSYAVVKAEKRTVEAVFRAIKENRVKNFTKPSHLFKDMLPYFFRMLVNKYN